MNYLLEERRNALAAQYVLGTLRGLARRRYQKLMMQHQIISETTWLWEQHLNDLGQKLTPISPALEVWTQIELKLGFVTPEHESPPANVIRLLKKKTTLWQSLTGLAVAAALILAVILQPTSTPVAPQVAQYAIVNDSEANPLWVIEVTADKLIVRSTEKLAIPANNDFELWMVPANGEAPISLGLLPKNGKLNITRPAWFDTAAIAALAVSLEPIGGSPNGSPTEVLYISPLIAV